MILPFIPESIESMKERFPICLVKIWNPKDINAGGDRPGMFRDYVFDFESGLRLLISKTAFFPHDTSVHVSASWEHDIPIDVGSIDELTKQIEESFHLIGGKGRLTFIGMSSRFISHWLVVEDRSN